MKRLLALAILAGFASFAVRAAWTTPLPAGTTLTIVPGLCSGGAYISGSLYSIGSGSPTTTA